MSGALPQRIAVFTPLPPVRSGIAAYNAGFLPSLAEHFDVTVFVDDHDFPSVGPVAGTRIRPASSYVRRAHGFPVFHMGNNGRYHRYIHEELCRTPGLTVLHDLRLTDFYRWMEHRSPGSVDLALPRSLRTGTDADPIDIDSIQPILARSRAVLVHSGAMARRVRAMSPSTRVFEARLAMARAPVGMPAPTAELFGWPESSLVVGSIGGIGRHKGIHRLLPLVDGLRRSGMDVRLVISGWVFDPAYLAELEDLVTSQSLEGVVRIVTDTSDHEMSLLYQMCDVTIDLRDNMTGASSMSLLTSLSHRRPTIATALDEFRDVADPFLHLVSADHRIAVGESSRLLAEMATAKARHRETRSPEMVDHCAERLDRAVAEYVEAIQSTAEMDDPPRSVISKSDAREIVGSLPRVTVVGDLQAATGLMQYGRRLIETLHGAGARLDHFHLEIPGVPRSPARDVGNLSVLLPGRRESDIELWLLNINEFNVIDSNLIRPPGTTRHIIGSWFWELPTVQSPFVEQFHHVDELWVGSPFIARTFRQYTDVPITVVPMPITAVADDSLDRTSLGLPEDGVIYFFDFDAHSHASRKNPFGLISAFRRAFSPDDRDQIGRRPVLVIKTRRLDHPFHRILRDELRRSMDDVGGILIDGDLDKSVFDTLVARSDVYVSMHRAEGLGIGMLEAMHLGKPVISPAYPDKWLFPASALGMNVPSPLRHIDENDQRIFPEASIVYTVGLSWAEPDVDRTATLMRLLFDEPRLRERVGARAASLVREHYSAPAALSAMASSLNRVRVLDRQST